MKGLRSPLLLGLVFIMFTAGYCKERTEHTDMRDCKTLLNLIMETVNELNKYSSQDVENSVQYLTKQHDYTFDPKGVHHYKSYSEDQRVAHVIAKAQGLAIMSVIKAGFLVTARGGSGIVVARLPDGRWSAPSAIGIAGLGGGFEIGVEVSDLVIILNHKRAVEAFAKGGNLTLGGNCTVAIGPLGRNIEGDVAVRSTAAVYTYCKSRGLFAGVSLEGSYLIERKDANKKFYCQDIRAFSILLGDVEPPAVAEELYSILSSYSEKYINDGQRENMRRTARKTQPVKPLSKSQTQRSPVNGRSGDTDLRGVIPTECAPRECCRKNINLLVSIDQALARTFSLYRLMSACHATKFSEKSAAFYEIIKSLNEYGICPLIQDLAT
ncbi:SH3 domain-containing YSC84-like protein 1 [Acipenser ruthenus]|uniref:SH3 domain-containing YSC84-like protein 1 n=1 Tax=Acipenser ruthenus TaxID=7906 RepID=A0A444U8B6_ACIRT|nr:SH3 domain-containing YSC84-like protein 1 [Acipenser ruthenus]